MASILFLIRKILHNQFGRNYLKINFFWFVFPNFSNIDYTLNISKNKVNLIADVLTKLRTPKGLVR